MSSKKLLVQTIDDLPEGLTIEEAIERLYQIYRVREGLRRRAGAPAAEEPPRSEPRPVGLLRGHFTVPKEFFDPLPADLEAAFSGE